MSVLHELTLLLDQAQAASPTQASTPEAVEVTLVDAGKAWWKDYAVPAATLLAAGVGGIGGVLLGGRMNRTTMNAVERDRAHREDLRDAAKAERDLIADRRVALGSLRLLMDQLQRAASRLEQESSWEEIDLWAIPSIDTEMRFRPEDEHAIAIWVSDDIWRAISKSLDRVERANAYRARLHERLVRDGETDVAAYCALARGAQNHVCATLDKLEPEFRRLARDHILDKPSAATAPA